ncbi:MAG: four helix bundle protein [Cyclobacteriaceae bacterium]|nr:four helix bundle protein [Cyclobacteriaceae bacterium]
MTKITRFEDLKCWQLSRELVRQVYQACDQGKLSKDFETRDQIKSAALSVMNNIAEGFGRYSNKEFIRFLDFSQSSAIEVKSITYALEDLEYLSMDKIIQIREKAEETKNTTLAFIRYLKNRNKSTQTP